MVFAGLQAFFKGKGREAERQEHSWTCMGSLPMGRTYGIWRTTMPSTAKQYTLSFWARADEDGAFAVSHFFNPNTTTYFISNMGFAGQNPDGRCEFRFTTEWRKYWVVYTQSETTEPKSVIFPRMWKSPGGGNVYVKCVKLEQGNRPTDWTPAPEDYSTTEQMNSAIKQSADSIKTEVNGTLNNYATTASLELKVSKNDNSQIISMINASADVIKLSSNRFQLDSTYAKINLDGTVAFTGGTIGGFQITSTGINAANGLVGMNITSGWAFHAGNIIAGTDRTVFCVGHEGNVYCHNFWTDNAVIVGGSINVNNNFIVDSSGNLTSKGSADFQCATTYANDFHSRGSIYAASNIDAGSTIGCNDILVKNNAYVREQFYYWYNDSWVRLRDYITAIINGG